MGDYTLRVEHSANGARDANCRAAHMKFEAVRRNQGHKRRRRPVGLRRPSARGISYHHDDGCHNIPTSEDEKESEQLEIGRVVRAIFAAKCASGCLADLGNQLDL